MFKSLVLFLPKKTSEFVKTQVNLNSQKRKGRKYTKNFKKFCLNAFFSGSESYSFWSKTFSLPTPRSLKRSIQNLQIMPGLHDFIFEFLKIKVEKFPQLSKFCNICIDTASIKSNLFYMINRDEVIGFEDYGDGKKSILPAGEVAVVMVKSTMDKWQQPLAYFLLNKSFDSEKSKCVILDCIYKLQSIGLIVLSLITDMGSDYRKMIKLLGVTKEKPYFTVENQKIFYMFDPPHDIKACRNNFMENNIFVNNNLIDWKWVQKTYEYDQNNLHYKLVPKLGVNHITPNNFQKMRVYLAVQVLSNTMASAIRTHVQLKNFTEDALHTATFIEYMDGLFDIFNSSGGPKEFNKPFTKSPIQKTFLLNAKKYLSTITVLNSKGVDITNNIVCFKGWLHNIKSLNQLWTYTTDK